MSPPKRGGGDRGIARPRAAPAETAAPRGSPDRRVRARRRAAAALRACSDSPERRQGEAEVVRPHRLIGRQPLGRPERLGRLVPALDPLVGETEAAVRLRRFRVDAQRLRETGDRIFYAVGGEQGVGQVALGRAELGAGLRNHREQLERLVVLAVRGQRDAEAGDRVEILTARDLDDPPQTVDGPAPHRPAVAAGRQA